MFANFSDLISEASTHRYLVLFSTSFSAAILLITALLTLTVSVLHPHAHPEDRWHKKNVRQMLVVRQQFVYLLRLVRGGSILISTSQETHLSRSALILKYKTSKTW